MQRVYLSSHFVSFRNISQNCPMPSSPVNVTFCPSTSIRYCERVRFKGQRTQPQVGVRKTLAFSCVMQRVYLSSHFVSFRNISQNCPMPSSPVNVTSVNVLCANKFARAVALNRYALTASEERSKRLHLRKSNAADIANNRTRSVKCKALARKHR